MELVRTTPAIHGNVWWPGYEIPKNPDGFTDTLRKYQAHIALMPQYKHIDTLAPATVEKLTFRRRARLFTHKLKLLTQMMKCSRAVYYCIYLNDDAYPVAITQNTYYELVPERIGGLVISVSSA